jgi:hypothetical protein
MLSIPSRWTVRAAMMSGVLGAALAVSSARAGFTIFTAGGDATPASIQATVDAFRTALGSPNNGNNPGPLASGRREINWDGGGATLSTSSGTPLTACTNNRGATFTTPGTGFLQTPLADPAFVAINPTYATTFSAFSPIRIFTPLGSNITDAAFAIPGSSGAVVSTVNGFGAVFSDVDVANQTKLQFFDVSNNPLFTVAAPTGTVPSGSLSFIGAIANAGERISRVRITTGNAALGPNDNNGDPTDVVVMDDFLYSEPTAVPEPTGLLLGAIGIVAMTMARRRRSL